MMSEVANDVEVDGVDVERTSSGRIRFVRIDLDTHPFVASILKEHGLLNGAFSIDNEEDDVRWLIPTPVVEVDCRKIKWSKSMLQAFDDIKCGRMKRGDINNFWRIGEEVDV